MLKSVEMCPTSSAPDSTHSRRKWWRRATCLILLKEVGSWASATVALLSIQRRVGPDSGKRRAAAAELVVELLRHGLAHGVGERGVADAPEQRLHLGGERGAPVVESASAIRDGLVAVREVAVLVGEDAGLEQLHEEAAVLLGAANELVHLARAAEVDDVGEPGAVGSWVLQVVQALELDLVVEVGRHRWVSSGFVGFVGRVGP